MDWAICRRTSSRRGASPLPCRPTSPAGNVYLNCLLTLREFPGSARGLAAPKSRALGFEGSPTAQACDPAPPRPARRGRGQQLIIMKLGLRIAWRPQSAAGSVAAAGGPPAARSSPVTSPLCGGLRRLDRPLYPATWRGPRPTGPSAWPRPGRALIALFEMAELTSHLDAAVCSSSSSSRQ